MGAAPAQNGLRKRLFGAGAKKTTKKKDPESSIWGRTHIPGAHRAEEAGFWGRRDRAAGTYSAHLDFSCLFFKGFCARFGVFFVCLFLIFSHFLAMLLFGPIWGHFMSLRRCLNGERGGGEKKKQQNTTNPPRTPHHHCRFWGEKLRNGHKPPLPPLSAQHCCHQKPTSSTAMPTEGHGAVHCCADCSFWGHFLPFWGTFSHCFSFLNGWKTSKTWVDGDDPPGVKHHHSDTTAPNLSGSPIWVKNSTNTYFLPFLHVFWEVLLPGSLCLFVSGVHAASVLGQFPAVLVLSLICAKIPCCQHPAPLFFCLFSLKIRRFKATPARQTPCVSPHLG